MREPCDLSPDERAVLVAATAAPICDPPPPWEALCRRLCARGLLQRAGGVAVVNGWDGSPYAFMLTREGWREVTRGWRHVPVRRVS